MGEDRLVSFQGILVVSVQCLLAVQGTLKSLLQHHSSKASIAFISISEEVMVTHSNILAWKIPWMEEPGRLQSMGSLRVGYD